MCWNATDADILRWFRDGECGSVAEAAERLVQETTACTVADDIGPAKERVQGALDRALREILIEKLRLDGMGIEELMDEFASEFMKGVDGE